MALTYSMWRCVLPRHFRDPDISSGVPDGRKSIPGRTPSLTLNTGATTGWPSPIRLNYLGSCYGILQPRSAH
jgi:hypothetical protein